MPRGKRRTPKKSSISKDSEGSVEDTPENPTEVAEEKNEETSVKEEISVSLKEEAISADDAEEQIENAEGDDCEVPDEAEQMEEAEEETEQEKSEVPETEEAKEQPKKPLSVEDWPVTSLAPHKVPAVMNNKLKEKWEWHMRIYPIDQSDIRRCVLDSVSKIAQETWFYIDKSNYGMGAYDLCMRTCTDAAMVMLKTLRAQMMYRYVTVEVTKRGKNTSEVQRIKDNPPPVTKSEKTSEGSSEEQEDGIEEAIEALPYTEILETATLHLDYLHTLECDKVKGKEKKRSLYVKYLPEHTSKELLKVLFPVAINLDIISTGAGRRVGELDVVTMENLFGVVQAYITVHINGCRTITFNWDKDDLNDDKVAEVTKEESPWELLPRDYEVHYEAVPEVEVDENVQYRKRKREMDVQHKRAMENHARRREERRRGGKDAAHELMHLQMTMNAKIQSQLALLHAVDGPPPLMGLDTEMMMDPAMMRDRKRDRFERDRMEMEMSRRMPGNFPPYEMDRGGRMGMSERDMRGQPGFMSPRDRERNFFEGAPGRGGGFGGRGGRFEGDRQWSRDGDRGRGGRRPEGSGRTRPSRFDAPRERFDSSGSGGQNQDGNAQQNTGETGRGRGGLNNSTGGTGRGALQSKGSEASGQDGKGSKNKPVAHGFPSNPEQSGDNQRSQNQYPNRSGGGREAGNPQKQGGFGNRGGFNNRSGFGNERQDSGGNRFQNQNRGFGFQNQQSGFRSQNQQGNFGSGQNQSGNYGPPQNRQGGFGSPQNRQNSFGNQGQQRGFGSNQNRQGGFGGNQNQQGRFGGNQNQGGYGGNQNQGYGGNQNQGGYGGNQNQGGFGGNQNQGGFGGNQNQGGFGGNQSQGFGGNQNQQGGFGGNQSQQAGYMGYQQSNFGSGAGQQNSYSTMGNQGSNFGAVGSQPNSYGTSGNQQTGFGSNNQQAAYGTNQQASYGTAQGNQQSGYGNMQSQNYGNQQSYSTQQASYGSYNTMQQQDQTYSTQQQQTGYSTGASYDWSQQTGSTNYNQSYSGQATQQQGQQQQDFTAYSTAYPGFTTNNPSAASGYGADSAFANQGLYNATQSSDSYGTYEGYGTSNQQSSVAGYNYGQYQASS